MLSVDVGTDYRQLTIKGVPAYLSPLNDANRAAMEAAFERLSDGAEVSPELIVENRPLRAVRCADEVARRAAERYAIICFDEFHISDIADAMILERLLHAFFQHRLVFVMTSNYVPDALYPDGLHRDAILPAIALLNQNLDVMSVDVGTDYR